MAYTGHGHQITGSPATGIPPKQRARCGGPVLCNSCQADVALYWIKNEGEVMSDNISVGAEDIEHRFGFHKATIEGPNATLPMHAETRIQFRRFAEYLDKVLPPGRAKSVAFTELENASMWSHKAIAETAPTLPEGE